MSYIRSATLLLAQNENRIQDLDLMLIDCRFGRFSLEFVKVFEAF